MRLIIYFFSTNNYYNQNCVSGYFIERYIYFTFWKKNPFNFTNNFLNYNSKVNNYFHSLQQCFYNVKLEKLKFHKNLVSRVNLLKLRFEYSNVKTSQMFISNGSRIIKELKVYGSLNNLPLIPEKINLVSIIKIKFVLKKLFFKKPNNIYFYWFLFFRKMIEYTKENSNDLELLIGYFKLDLNRILGKRTINKLISYSKNHSWIIGFINLLNYQRKLYDKKNTILYIRTGLLRLGQFFFSRYLAYIKRKVDIFSRLNTSLSFSTDPVFNQIIQSLRLFSTNFFTNGFYGFRVLASKKKLPIKIFSPLFKKNWLLSRTFINFFKNLNLKTVILSCIQKKNFLINYHHFLRLCYKSKTFYFKLPKKDPIFNQLIIKEAVDFHNEIGAIFLLSQFEKILREYQVNIWLNPISINSYYYNGGSVEVIPNSNSIHEIKSLGSLNCLTSLSEKKLGKQHQKKSIENFIESIAGYSLFCYILQIKDRHNANILLNKDNRIIHVDFAFILGSFPGNLKLEAASFKMSEDFVYMLKGNTTQSFDQLKEIFTRGFLIIRKSIGRILKISNQLILEIQSITKARSKLLKLIKRFNMKINNSQCIKFCNSLFKDSLEDWRTKQYDKYQNLASGINF